MRLGSNEKSRQNLFVLCGSCCNFQSKGDGGYVEVRQIIQELDHEIGRLKEARALLVGGTSGRKRGRPPGKAAAPRKVAKKRHLSPEGRKRISDALKRRWAAHRKAAAKTAKAA
jgi:hypothetical protein